MILYVARHGETNWNRDGRYQGRRESDLTERGRAQARALADALSREPIGRAIASPLRRCVESARPLAQSLGLALETDAALQEISHGDWEGRLRADIEREDGETMRTWRDRPHLVHFTGGESLADVRDRWRAFVSQPWGERDAIVVTHDVVVRVAVLEASGRPLNAFWNVRVANGAFAVLERRDGAFRVRAECVDAHLGALATDMAGQAL